MCSCWGPTASRQPLAAATCTPSNPKTADDWEPYLAEKRREVDQLTRQLADAEAEINHRVYRLFNLTPGEIKLLEREVEH